MKKFLKIFFFLRLTIEEVNFFMAHWYLSRKVNSIRYTKESLVLSIVWHVNMSKGIKSAKKIKENEKEKEEGRTNGGVNLAQNKTRSYE